MNMKDSRPTSMPIVESRLLSKSSFVSYCKERGVETSSEELLDLEKEGFFYPAVRVLHPIARYRKSKKGYSSSKTGNFFSYVGIDRSGERWLKKYDHFLPESSTGSFITEVLPKEEFSNDRSMYEGISMAFYMPEQIMLLDRLNSSLTLRIGPSSFIRYSPEQNSISEQLARATEQVRRVFPDIRKDFYRRVQILYIGLRIEDLLNANTLSKFSKLTKEEPADPSRKKGTVTRGRVREVQASWKDREKNKRIEKMMKRAKTTIEEMATTLEWLIYEAESKDLIGAWRTRLTPLPSKLVGKEKGRVLYASTCFDLLNRLLWSISGTPWATKETMNTINRSGSIRVCQECSEPIIFSEKRGRPNKYTCGKPKCVKAYRQRLVSTGKKIGKYV